MNCGCMNHSSKSKGGDWTQRHSGMDVGGRKQKSAIYLLNELNAKGEIDREGHVGIKTEISWR